MHTRYPLTRRLFLGGLGTATFLGSRAPSQAAANKPKLIVVILRGGMDGLFAVPKMDERYLEMHRPKLVLANARPLSDGFALHPAFKNLHSWYTQGQASFAHAITGPWRNRSHFYAQDLLESGDIETVGRDGWLNRAIHQYPGLTALSIGPVKPLILTGEAGTSNWSPPVLPEVSEDTVQRLFALYENQPLMLEALMQSQETQDVLNSMDQTQRKPRKKPVIMQFEKLAQIMRAKNGPDIGVVDVTGWDTHAGQPGSLNGQFSQLDAALATARVELGGLWAQTMIAVVTEFGRTVRENGTRGTDHGTASAAFLAGGALKGGRVLGDWPGLAPKALYENRDLYPANDLHGLFKGLLTQLYGFERTQLNAVFPDTKDGPVMAL